jgi:hypothetical protein
MRPEADLRLLVQEALQRALVELRQGVGWQRDEALDVIPGPVRRYLGVDTRLPLDEQRRELTRLIEEALQQLPEHALTYVNWAFNPRWRPESGLA